MNRSHSLIVATTVIIGAIPQMAQASCNGNACSAVSAAASWNASDKRVNAVLTNKDQAKGMQVKFCITVEGKCNSFELTLSPRSNAIKSVLLSGMAAPKKFEVEVSSADFAGGQSSSSGAVNGVEVARFGKFTYNVSAESAVGPLLRKAVASFAAAEDLDLQLLQRDNQLSSITQKLESVKNIEADVQGNNKKSKPDVISARNSDVGFEAVTTILDYMQNEAKAAVQNFAISQDDLQAVEDKKRAEGLMAEAEKSRQSMLRFVNMISFAMDAAKKVVSGPEGQAALALDAANKVIDEFVSNPWADEAKKLLAEADRLQAKGARDKLKLAGDHLKLTQDTVARLRPTLQSAKANNAEAWQIAKQTYDDNTKGRFQWKNLDAAIPEAQEVIELAKRTTEAAYGAREAARALERTGGSNNWATPGENQRIVIQMVDKMSTVFDHAIKKRQIVELLLKKLEEATATAKGAL
jgi:hypothetical protein